MEFELPKDFKELLELLNRHEVKYLLIGGYAVGLHGHARTTNDIDIAVADDEANVAKVANALEEFGFNAREAAAQLFSKPRSLVIMGVEPMAIDILNYIDGTTFDTAYGRRKSVRVEDIDVSLIGLEDLLLNKRYVGRLKDLADVEYLERVNFD